jgi:hypothetical protein
MTTVFLTMPDDPLQRRAWLEQQLTGLHLRDLVLELEALRETPPLAAPPLADTLGESLPMVLHAGLAAASDEAVRQLIRHPRLLLELQEQILLADSPYWEHRLEENTEVAEAADRVATRFRESLAEEEPARVRLPVQSSLARNPWLAALATAAALLLTTFGLIWAGVLTLSFGPAPEPEVAQRWGWDRPGAIPEGVPAGEYYDALARAARQWGDVRPDDREALLKRIGEYRQGCSRLLIAAHEPLRELGSREDAWLVERCQRWAYRLDQLRDDLEAGRKAVTEVRDAVDEMTRRIVSNLESRADHVRSLTES